MQTPFPQAERIAFDRNPLVEVICQIRFDGELGSSEFNSSSASKFHSSLREQFPFFERKEVDSSGDDSELSSLVEYNFINESRDCMVTFSRSFISFSTLRYQRWEKFFDQFSLALNALEALLGQQKFSRVGLRYQDVICRSDLGFDVSEPWINLLRQDIVPLRSNDLIRHCVTAQQTRFAIKLNDNSEMLAADIFTANRSKDDEECFIIDADFFDNTEVKNASGTKEVLSKFNRYARDFFQWCITEKLKEALGPKKI